MNKTVGHTELDCFRLPDGFKPAPPKKREKSRIHQSGPFIRGPIPLAWLEPVLAMSGRSPLAVALALHFQAGLERSARVRVTGKLRNRFRLSTRAVSRSLALMESAGLIAVTRKPGRCHVVDILKQ